MHTVSLGVLLSPHLGDGNLSDTQLPQGRVESQHNAADLDGFPFLPAGTHASRGHPDHPPRPHPTHGQRFNKHLMTGTEKERVVTIERHTGTPQPWQQAAGSPLRKADPGMEKWDALIHPSSARGRGTVGFRGMWGSGKEALSLPPGRWGRCHRGGGIELGCGFPRGGMKWGGGMPGEGSLR